MHRKSLFFFSLLTLVCIYPVQALEDISNYRDYSPVLSSSGQPSAEQLRDVAAAGFARVIYLAPTDARTAIEHEDAVVTGLGMDYVHIPVIWEKPRPVEFELMAAVLRQAPGTKTLVHCQVNFRASAFSFLYRVIHEGVSVAEAKSDMNSVWMPNETWRDFIFEVLRAHGVDPECEVCDWVTEPMTH